MNKSLALRNKIYRFCFLLFSFFLFLYLLYFLLNGERGVLKYNKIIRKHDLMISKLNYLEDKNNKLEDNISRLSPNSIDLEYLDEQLRINLGNFSKDELVIILDK